MDAYSAFSSTAAPRDSSRLDLDLASTRHYSTGTSGRSSTEQTPSPGSGSPHVGIIGAGIAGLRCADILLHHGFRVTIIEGRRRLGGRMHQTHLTATPAATSRGEHSGPLVDMGPNWIHGTKDNPILDLVRATNTVTSSHVVDEQGRDLSGAVFDASGELLPLDEGEAVSTAMWKIIEEAFVHSNTHSATLDPAESLHDFFLQRLDAHVLHDGAADLSPDAVARRKELVLQMANSWGAFVGSPVSRQSLKYFWLEECIEGENLFCAGTYKNVLDRLIAPVVQGATICYGQTVSRIMAPSRDEQPPSNTGTQSPAVRVITTSGDTYTFDEVVCTAPLGWLKKHAATAFEPALPPRMRQAIDSIGYGSLEKVYISFPEAFWHRPHPETGRIVRGFCQWLAPGSYAQPHNPQHWTLEAVDMAAFPASVAHPTLLYYIFGPQSDHVMGTLATLRDDKDAAGGACSETYVPNAAQTAFLTSYFQPYFSTLPNYDATSPACQPTACIATNWLHDDLAGNGSYSNFQVGLTHGDEDIRVMREGLPVRGTWLAGEHTAPFVALGTATGAYWSGESVAHRITEAYGRDGEPQPPNKEAAVPLVTSSSTSVCDPVGSS